MSDQSTAVSQRQGQAEAGGMVPVADSKLPPRQVAALAVIASGGTLSAAAAAGGVDRATLYRWRRDDAQFIAALNAWRGEQILHAKDRLLGMAQAASDAIGAELANGNGRLGLRVLTELGCSEPGPTQPTDPAKVFPDKHPTDPAVRKFYDDLYDAIGALPYWLRDRAAEVVQIGHRVFSPLLIRGYPPYPEQGRNREECKARTEEYYRNLAVARKALAQEVACWPEFRSYLDEQGLLKVRQDPSPAELSTGNGA